jgi:hypothetical protein
MVCETKKEAARVAYFGAIKMDAQNYQLKEFWPFVEEAGTLRRGGYTVRRGLTSYTVQDTDGAEKRTLTCTCPFYRDNAAHGVCKHITRIEWLLRDREEQIEEDVLEDRIAAEAELRMGAECPIAGCVSDKWRGITAP